MRRLLQIPLLLLAMLLGGAAGLHVLTGRPLLLCFYQAVILLTTVGSSEPEPMSDGTRLFVIVYLFCGVGLVTYSAFQFGETLVNANLRQLLERRRMVNRIARLEHHFIVCGYGRMGSTLCRYLHSRRQPFVVIDENEEIFDEEFHTRQWKYICGDASNDETLLAAGVTRARGLTSVLPTDADNLYVVLSARLLAPELQIVARASNDRAARKMTQAGATRVINPFAEGATRMARCMLSPSLENFVEVAESHGIDWQIADFVVPDNSHFCGRQISNSGVRDLGVMLLGVATADGEKHFPPPSDLTIRAGDSLFAFGNSDSVAQLAEWIEQPATGDSGAASSVAATAAPSPAVRPGS